MKILAFGASSSSTSINKQFAAYAGSLIEGGEVETIDLNDYELPLFSEDTEKALGQPTLAKDFYEKIAQSDVIIISFAEHNGSYTAAYKNLFDWTSRINQKLFQNKPMILLATSPGAGGAANVLAAAMGSAPFFAGDVKGSMSLPSFYDNFDSKNQVISNATLKEQLEGVVSALAK